MAICLDIHFRHEIIDLRNYDSCVSLLNSAAEKLQSAFGIPHEQIHIHAWTDAEIEETVQETIAEWEQDGKNFTDEDVELERSDWDSYRYEINIESPLSFSCHLEKGFWAIGTCEAYSLMFNPEFDTRQFVEKIVRTFGADKAYISKWNHVVFRLKRRK